LLDLNLPDSSGLETLRQLSRADRHYPVIVLTESTEEGLGVEALLSGADDYVSKAELDNKMLPRTIRYAIDRKGVQEQLRRVKQLEVLRQITGATIHEFNNLIAILSGNLELLSDEIVTESSLFRVLKMKAALGRMASLIQNQVQFTRQQTEQAAPLVKLNDALNNLEHMLQDSDMGAANNRAII
jgi:CheY-like chemotaxis protein